MKSKELIKYKENILKKFTNKIKKIFFKNKTEQEEVVKNKARNNEFEIWKYKRLYDNHELDLESLSSEQILQLQELYKKEIKYQYDIIKCLIKKQQC